MFFNIVFKRWRSYTRLHRTFVTVSSVVVVSVRNDRGHLNVEEIFMRDNVFIVRFCTIPMAHLFNVLGKGIDGFFDMYVDPKLLHPENTTLFVNRPFANLFKQPLLILS